MRNILSAALGLALVVSSSVAMAGYTSTKYPIVLVHGVAGFDTIGGLINYFHRVPYNLERSGAEVHATAVSFVNSSDQRGEQLKDYILGMGKTKVNLMAHSQGAPTSRVAASKIPEKIASITSINGVNFGSTVADVIREVIPPGSYVEGGADAIANALGGFINQLIDSDNPQDGIAALETLTYDGTYKLNKSLNWKGVNKNGCGETSVNVSIPDKNGTPHTVKMYSWGGKTMYTNALDAIDPFLLITSKAFSWGEKNDGLVSSCSQKMGKVISVNYNLNHADAVNHLFGLHHVFLEPISLYRSQANRLKNAGL